ncbi:MAG TPA: hypothetical protein PLD20_24845 [Blastocatellia bacterium]|nr:hypothetical protein [Blastocatellia bacterium]HMX26442.1 hypothetical protein [Blastocatellia bacterium]HMZ21186.1 hypothetical protein [Blastocatellia bacterium]HNG28505.1 hypothetical protein [Blastocatellia bacterium]
MRNFYLSYGISALVLLLLTWWAGRQAKFEALGYKPTIWGMLIDNRERFSLNRLQIVVWSLLILSTFLAVLAQNLRSDPGKALALPKELLSLLGISVSSAVVVGAIKNYKDVTRPETIAGGRGFLNQRKAVSKAEGIVVKAQQPSFIQVFLEEEGIEGENQVISITKFQNYVFTVALWVVYVVLAMKARGYPALDENVLWLIGISHAGYIGGKLPNKGPAKLKEVSACAYLP